MYTILSFECFNSLDYCQRFLGLKYIHVIIHSINVEQYRHQICFFFLFLLLFKFQGMMLANSDPLSRHYFKACLFLRI